MSRKNELKVAVIGMECVGKSVLCNAMDRRTINRDYDMTIGVDLIITYFNKDNNNIQLSLWDMAGQNQFDSITDAYVATIPIPVLLFCYSADRYCSFQGMIKKHNFYYINGHVKGKHVVVTMCKSELSHQFPTLEQMGKDFANEYGYKFVKTSAFKKEGLEELKEALINLPKPPPPPPPPPSNGLKQYFETCIIV